MKPLRNILAGLLLGLLLIAAVPVCYLLMLMISALFYRRPRPKPAPPVKFVALIPAHNEALTLPGTLPKVKALRAADGSEPLVVVVADNCTDNTASLARQGGALVYERHNTELRGKGHALKWAIERLLAEYPAAQFNALVIFDADTVPDEAFLKEAESALSSGAQVIQGRYDVLKPDENRRTLLLYSAFVIYNHIRPLGRAALKLSDGLRGNGMVFRREVLERFPWQAFSIVEDIEYTNRLALAGLSVTYVPQAKVYGQAASTGQQAASQRMRWEGGRWQQARQDIPRLLGHAWRKADPITFDRAMDLIIPPLALLVLGLGAMFAFSALLWLLLGGALLGLVVLGWAGLLGLMATFVFGGLGVARVPAKAYLALIFAPVYILWKIGVYFKMIFERTPREWVRTQRSKIELNEVNK